MVFEYKTRSAAAWEKQATTGGVDFPGFIDPAIKMYAAKKGDNFVRILPPTWENPQHFGLLVHAHYSIGPENAAVLCLAKMKGERCPICEARTKLERTGDEEGAKELSPRKRVLVWILDRKETNTDPLLWAMPPSLNDDIVKLARDPQSGEWLSIDSPHEGYDISFSKDGEKLLTKYNAVQLARRSTSVPDDVLEYIAALPIPDLLVWRSYDEIQSLYTGGVPVGEDAPAASRPAMRPVAGAASTGASAAVRRPVPALASRAAKPVEQPVAEEDPPPADEGDYGETPHNPETGEIIEDPPFEASTPVKPATTRPVMGAARSVPASTTTSGADKANALRARLAANKKA